MSFKNKKKILIVEPFHTGHHISLYLRNLLEEFERQNISINILTSLRTYQSEVFKQIEKDIDIENIFLLRETAEPKNQNYLNILFYEIKWWLIIKKEFLKIKKLHKFEKKYILLQLISSIMLWRYLAILLKKLLFLPFLFLQNITLWMRIKINVGFQNCVTFCFLAF